MAAKARVEASEAAMRKRKQRAAQQAAERARVEAAAEEARQAADATAMGWAAIVEQRQWLGKAEVQASNLLTEAETDAAPRRQTARPRVQPPAGPVVANVSPSKLRRKSSPARKRATTREALAAADAAQRKGAATRAAASSVPVPGMPPLPLSTAPMPHAVFKV